MYYSCEQLKKTVASRINHKDKECEYIKECLHNFGIEISWIDYFNQESYENFLIELGKVRENYDPYAYSNLLKIIAGERGASQLHSYVEAICNYK